MDSNDNSQYISDPKLVPRIKTFLQENDAATKSVSSVDPQDVAEYLQSAFSEYKRRKQKAFIHLVSKALQIAERDMKRQAGQKGKQNKLSALPPKTGSKRQRQEPMDTDSDSNEDLVYYKDTNSVNNSLRNLYKESSKQQSPQPNKVQLTAKNKVLSQTREPSGKEEPTDPEPSWYLDRAGSEGQSASFVVDGLPHMEMGKPIQETESQMAQSLPLPLKNSTSKKKIKRRVKDADVDATVDVTGVVQLQPTINFLDFGGHDNILRDLAEELELFFKPDMYRKVDITPNRGILLHGPPGCGKSHLAHCIAGHLCVPLLQVASTSLVSGLSGDSEKNIRKLFEQARASVPCILFIDNIDSVAAKTENALKDMERRMAMQLMSCMDELKTSPESILVIGATRRPDAIDRALRIQGRFGMEIALGIPDEKAREAILQNISKKMKLAPDIDLKAVAQATPGFLGGDLDDVKRQAGRRALKRYTRLSKLKIRSTKDEMGGNKEISQGGYPFITPLPPGDMEDGDIQWSEKEEASLTITTEDFLEAVKKVQPSALREGFATVPDVTWDDIGAMRDVRSILNTAILGPARYPDVFKSLGLEVSSGVLLVGPPGCGKTLIAKAVANETGINFISVRGPELMNMYVGESERAVRQVFERARNSAPCVIFFDELDSICPRRSDQDNQSSARVVNQLLTEMDGLESRKHVYIMAATNRLDILDPAVLRPGRLGKVVHVPMPSSQDRFEILRTITKDGTRPCLGEDVDLKAIAESPKCEGFSGADLKALVEEAATVTVREFLMSDRSAGDKIVVTKSQFDKALETARPSVSRETQAKYVRAALRQW